MKNYEQFHDGSLDGLLLAQDSVQVFLSTEKKQSYVLLVHGVVALSADGFKAGNIIFEVVTRQKEELTYQDMIESYGLSEDAGGEEQAKRLLLDAQKRSLVVLEINPSYGATCIILAESVDLKTRQDQTLGELVAAL